MRYLGSKTKLLHHIEKVISERAGDARVVADVFAGSGSVSTALKWIGYRVLSNDILYSSYTLLRGTIGVNVQPEFKGLNVGNPVEYLNQIEFEDVGVKIEDCFIYQNYSPNENCERKYFTPENALRIDIIRHTIEQWYRGGKINEDEYYYLKASLLEAANVVSNITGLYSAYLKQFDKRSSDRMNMVDFRVLDNQQKNQVFNMDAVEFAKNTEMDLAYLDPPYNGRQYGRNYHILDTIAKYDNPKISGVAGVREYESSDYCLKSEAYKALNDLVENLNTKYIIMSYNTEGHLNKDEVEEIFKRHGKPETYTLYEIPHKRFQSNDQTEDNGLMEQIYFVEKERS